MKKLFLAYEERILSGIALIILAILLVLVVVGIKTAISSTDSALNNTPQNEQVKFDFKTAEELNLGR